MLSFFCSIFVLLVSRERGKKREVEKLASDEWGMMLANKIFSYYESTEHKVWFFFPIAMSLFWLGVLLFWLTYELVSHDNVLVKITRHSVKNLKVKKIQLQDPSIFCSTYPWGLKTGDIQDGVPTHRATITHPNTLWIYHLAFSACFRSWKRGKQRTQRTKNKIPNHNLQNTK